MAIRLIEVTNIPVEDRALLQQIQISGWDLFQWKFRLFLKTLCREVHQPGKEGFIRLFQNNPFPFLELWSCSSERWASCLYQPVSD